MGTINVAIIHRTGFYIDAVENVLEQQPDIEVVDSQTIFEDDFCSLKDAEIIILQQETNKLTRRLIQQITAEMPDKKLVVLGAPDDDSTLVDYIESGAIGIVRESETFNELFNVVRIVHNGGTIVHPELTAPLCLRLAELGRTLREVYPGDPDLIDLTPRQQEVLQLLAGGKSNQEIAETLSISMGTVKNHVHKIFSQLGVRSREQATIMYSRMDVEADSDSS